MLNNNRMQPYTYTILPHSPHPKLSPIGNPRNDFARDRLFILNFLGNQQTPLLNLKPSHPNVTSLLLVLS